MSTGRILRIINKQFFYFIIEENINIFWKNMWSTRGSTVDKAAKTGTKQPYNKNEGKQIRQNNNRQETQQKKTTRYLLLKSFQE